MKTKPELEEDNYDGFCSHHYNNSCTCKIKCGDFMDTHDEEFGQLIRKQIQADKDAKAKRDNTHAQVRLSAINATILPASILNTYL